MLRSAGAGVLTRLANGASALTVETPKIGQSVFALEFVRWRRKPRWLPMAKSKLNRVPERKRQTPEERAELLRLHNNYHLQMRSLMQFFREEAQRIKETSSADHYVLTPEQEEEEFQRCLRENDEWNAKIAAEREVRLTKEREEKAIYIKQRLELAAVREEERMEKIEALVRREKELAKTFIMREQLDDAINNALANPIDYNFSIDLRGNIYHGRNTLPEGTGGDRTKLDNEETQLQEVEN